MNRDNSGLPERALEVLRILRAPTTPDQNIMADATLPAMGDPNCCGRLGDPFAFKQEMETDLHTGVSQERIKLIADIDHELYLVAARMHISLCYGIGAFSHLEDTNPQLFKLIESLREPDAIKNLNSRDAQDIAVTIVDELGLHSSIKSLCLRESGEARRLLLNFISSGTMPEDFRKKINDKLEDLSFVRTQYQKAGAGDILFVENHSLNQFDCLFNRARELHRMFISELATLMEIDERFSPVFRGAQITTKGIHQQTEQLGGDYGRSLPSILLYCEDKFQQGPEGRTSLHITGGGMQALHLAMKVVDVTLEQLGRNRPALIQNGIYWEIDRELQKRTNHSNSDFRHHDSIGYFHNETADVLAMRILNDAPSLVVAAPVGNSPTMGSTDIAGLLARLSDPDYQRAWHQKTGGQFLFLIIDNTTLGDTASWKKMDLSSLPNFLVFGSVESLIKLRQDGFDHAPAGSLQWISNNNNVGYFSSQTRQIRTSNGYTPPANTIYKLLLAPTSEHCVRRTETISKNTEKLAAALRQFNSGEGLKFDIITEPGAPFFHALLSEEANEWWRRRIEQDTGEKLQPDEIEKSILRMYITRALFNAESSYLVPLTEGTSFGFDGTRISLINYQDDAGTLRSCIRISAGIEDQATLFKVQSALCNAMWEVPRAMPRLDELERKSHELMGLPKLIR